MILAADWVVAGLAVSGVAHRYRTSVARPPRPAFAQAMKKARTVVRGTARAFHNEYEH